MPEVQMPIAFTMHGARIALTNGMPHIEEQIKSIERAVVEEPGLAFDLAKTLIESACKTILAERNIPFSAGDNLPKLFKTTISNLPFLPVFASGEVEVRKNLSQTLNGLHTAVQGICALRNTCGFASHGTDSPKPALETVQALLAAEAADTIVGFLHRVHWQDRVRLVPPNPKYDDYSEFNSYVDELHEQISIFGESFSPSKILFDMAPEAYRLNLTEYKLEPKPGEEEADDTTTKETTQ